MKISRDVGFFPISSGHRLKMLSLGLVSMGQEAYYVSLGPERYYLNESEPIGTWFGNGARAAGLFGAVEPGQIRNLFLARSPDGTRTLIDRVDLSRRRPAIDLTFSAPKSVSVVYAMADESVREAIRHAHQCAVQNALEVIQEFGGYARRGKRGVRQERVDLIFACFDHDTSRALDPQLHTHALLLNIAQRQDQTWGSVATREVFRLKMAGGATYRTELAYGLEQRLGARINRIRSWFEIDGVPNKVMKEFATRRREIERAVSRTEYTSAQAFAYATLETRRAKEVSSRAALLQRWQEIGQRFSFVQATVASILGRSPNRTDSIEDRLTPASHAALEILAAERNHFRVADLIQHIMQESQGLGVSSLQVRRFVQSLVQSAELVRLGVIDGYERLTLKTTAELEQRMLDRVDALKNEPWHCITDRHITAALARAKGLSEQQRKAVRRATGSDRLTVIEGYPGTGKSSVCKAISECYKRSGMRVIAVAPTGKAARALQEVTSIEARTVEGMLRIEERSHWDELKHHAKQLGRAIRKRPTYSLIPSKLNDRTVILVDEAGMVGVRLMDRLLKVAQEKHCKIVLLGDRNQLQPVLDYGGALAAISQRVGSSVLTEIARQREQWARDAVKDVADGRTREALDAFRTRGFLDIASNRNDSMARMVHDWMREGLRNPRSHLAILGTNDEVREFNRAIQSKRKRRLDLGLFGLDVGDERIHTHDRIVCTKNAPWLKIENGTLGTVRRVDILDREIEVDLDTGIRTRIPLKHFDGIRLGYAITVHRAQGITVENASVMLGGPMQNHEMTLVQISRARNQTRLYTNHWEAGENLENLAAQMRRTTQQELAVELQRRQELGPW